MPRGQRSERTARRRHEARLANLQLTHIVQSDVDVHLVHEPTESLVRLLGLAPPLLVRVECDYRLAHIDDAAEEVAQPVKVLDNELKLCVTCTGRPMQAGEDELNPANDVSRQIGQ